MPENRLPAAVTVGKARQRPRRNWPSPSNSSSRRSRVENSKQRHREPRTGPEQPQTCCPFPAARWSSVSAGREDIRPHGSLGPCSSHTAHLRDRTVLLPLRILSVPRGTTPKTLHVPRGTPLRIRHPHTPTPWPIPKPNPSNRPLFSPGFPPRAPIALHLRSACPNLRNSFRTR